MTVTKQMGQTDSKPSSLLTDTRHDRSDVHYLAGFTWSRLGGSGWSVVGHGVLPAEGKTLRVAWRLTGGSSHRDVVD